MIIAMRLLIILFICWASPVFGGTYWVSPTGSAAWSTCQKTSDPGVYCALAAANSNAQAGDTVYLKGGTYSVTSNYNGAIQPPKGHSGTRSSPIIFSAAPGENPVCDGTGYTATGFFLEGNSYIRITGITFQNFYWYGSVMMNGANHNEVDHCTFNNNGTVVLDEIETGSITHNWLHNNTITRGAQGPGNCVTYPPSSNPNEGGDLLDVGNAYGPSQQSSGFVGKDNNNTIENNTLAYGGHATVEVYGQYTVFKNNVVHNEPWYTAQNATGCNFAPSYTNTAYNGLYSHRNLQFVGDWGFPQYFCLIENNRVGYAGVNPDNDGANNFEVSAPNLIIRYNYFYGAMNSGIFFKYGSGTPGQAGGNGAGGWGGVYNRVYNNTFYDNGWGYPYWYTAEPGCGVCPDDMAGISVGGTSFGNVIINNLLYNNHSYSVYGGDIIERNGGLNPSNAIISNNWTTANGNPQFNNPDLTNTSSTTLPNLSLQSSSGAINAGTYLTTATNSGTSSTILAVSDAMYFQDGTWGSDLARPSGGYCGQGANSPCTLFPDWIAIGTVGNVVQIASVSYGTNSAPAGTITLASPMTWSNGAPIWLYQDSSGRRVLYGNAPDYGANEYGSVAPLQPPTNLRIVN